jgi:hypothetical protein
MDDWFEEVQQSIWAIRDDDAHIKQNTLYQNQEENLNHLQYAAQAHDKGSLYNPKIA